MLPPAPPLSPSPPLGLAFAGALVVASWGFSHGRCSGRDEWISKGTSAVQPLTRREFRRALERGHGRAIRHVAEHGTSGVRDLAIASTLHCFGFDPEIETSRASYQMQLIRYSGERAFFRNCILEALRGTRDSWDARQLFDLVEIFARDGDAEAREAIYRKFDRMDFDEAWVGGEQIVRLDGTAGLLHVAQWVGRRIRENAAFRNDFGELDEIVERIGPTEVYEALEQAAGRGDADVSKYLEEAVAMEVLSPVWGIDYPAMGYNDPHDPTTLEELLQSIDSDRIPHPGPCRHFGCRASQAEIGIVLERLIGEENLDRVLRYLWVFSARELPGLHPRVIELALSQNRDVQIAALTALSHTSRPEVRELAIHLLKTRGPSIFRGAIGLLGKNYRNGDSALVHKALFVPTALEDLFSMCRDTIELAESCEDPAMRTCLAWVYEVTPCAHCRHTALMRLLEWKAVPVDVLEECLFDSYDATRRAANLALYGCRG
jgi:hypothetical protein